ncbi:C40 family peptidase [Microlunatus soli]|uniref:Cell wall-associated hydrolase, NlpC family n=1 Tax=Microlunatus soli TaxID=630515 RepID=A0A1H1PLW0_9ACTN|nr:C40 family peptidase [Microlunatus soli]SDS12084.1 Cell wall-associated hydrolase, NlpC family [Microlunatus soli]
MSSRWLRRGAAVSLSGAVLAGTLSLCPQFAAADPAAENIAQAKAQVEKLQQEAAATDQEYLTLKEKLDQSNKELKDKQADVKAQTAKVAEMRSRVSKVALAQFQNRSLDTRTKLFLTRDTSGFLNQIATVEKVSQNQNSALQDYQVEQANLADLQRSTKAEVATLGEDQKKLAALRTKADDKVDQAQGVLDKLTAEERKRLELEQKRQEQEAKNAADSAQSGSSSSTATTTDSTSDSSVKAATSDDSSSSSSGSSKGAEVVAFAKAQIGKPYVFSATGPNAYDCSGLTLAAWKSVGVQLSRTSQSQINDGTRVSKSDLQPGDLVFFYSSTAPSHVGIYVGNGSIIHAPRPGKSVEYIKMSYMPFSGAVRPG